jgi:hypothetical protein
MASPIANDNPTVTVLLIAFLPYARPSESYIENISPFFRGRSRLQSNCILKIVLFGTAKPAPYELAASALQRLLSLRSQEAARLGKK